jgi:ParB family chromosome partitioning protein
VAKSALGKGLNALIPGGVSGERLDSPASPSGKPLTVPIGQVSPNPDQPRRDFDENALQELSDSVATHGIIQPIVVEPTEDGAYMIVAGERRWRAAKRAGLREVPVVVRERDELHRLELALIENIQREDLNPIEEAEAYRRLMEIEDADQERVAAAVGKSRSTVANALRLLKLPEEIRDAVRDDRISAGHARAILSAVNPADQIVLFQRILAAGLSVRQAEAAASDLNKGQRASSGRDAAPKPAKRVDPDVRALQERLIEALGTKVVIEGDGAKGHIKIEYYSMDDLERVLALIAK